MKKITNRIYTHKSQYTKHSLGHSDLVYYKQKRYDHRNPTKRQYLESLNDNTWGHCDLVYYKRQRYDHRNPTKRHLESLNDNT